MLSPLLRPVRLLPSPVHAGLLSRLVNHLLRGQGIKKRLAELDGKVISLGVDDLGIELCFRIQGQSLQAAWHTCPDVTIRGTSEAFLALALRRADPDTLFFQRRLSVEGETETGVHIKNLIDGFDYDLQGHFDATLPPALARMLGQLAMIAREHIYRPRTPGSPRQ